MTALVAWPLEHPAVDKLLAIIALAPMALILLGYRHRADLAVEDVLLGIEVCVVAVTMISRRPAKRVTRDPWLWALALLSVYWPMLLAPAYEIGQPVAPRGYTIALAVFAFGLSIWARVALGRNIGIVPAERGLSVDGPYRWVRHPICTALILAIVAAGMGGYTSRNACLDAAWCALLICKSIAEEIYLSRGIPYAAYMARVPDRWLPLRCLRR